MSRLHFQVIPTLDCSSAAKHVLARLLEEECAEYDERWLVLDTDHYTRGSHQKGFQELKTI